MTKQELEYNYRVEIAAVELSKGCPVAKDIFYACKKCDSVVPSIPDDSMGCLCKNVFVDIDYARISIKDESAVEILKVRHKRGFFGNIF